MAASLPDRVGEETLGPVLLERLSLRDFRNLERVVLDVPRDGMAIVGDNGHGKTNLLEAIYYLQLLRSVRGARDQDVVRFGAPGFHISAEATVGRRRTLSAAFQRAGKRKKVTVDGVVPTRLSDALGSLPSVMFSPRDVDLVAGSPSERRRFLDVALALTSRRYLAALAAVSRGARAAERRIAGCRETGRIRRPRTSCRVGAGVGRAWCVVVGRTGLRGSSESRTSSRGFARRSASVAKRGCVTRQRRCPAAASRAGWSVPDLAARLTESLEAHRSVDLRRGLTHVGPHRDDLELTLDGHALRAFGSAGQQRTASIALRLLEAATLRGAGNPPLVLLDDPFAELDAGRAARILDLLAMSEVAHQTILAVPRSVDIPREMTSLPRFQIVDGVVEAHE